MLVAIGIAVVVCGKAVHANPWPRERNQIFVAVSGTYLNALSGNDSVLEGNAYLEYGLTDRLTLGLSANDSQIDYTHAYGFVRWALSAPDQSLKLAASVGVGQSRQDNDWDHMVRAGFSVGRSMDLGKPGWWNVTAAVEEHALFSNPIHKLDATVGWNLNPRLQTIIDLETSQRSGTAPSYTARTSLAWAIRARSHLVVGIEAKEVDTTFLGLRLGWWLRY